MIKQTLMFTTPVSLSLKNQQLVVSIKESSEVITRPIEDIGFVIIENPMVRMSVPLLNAFADNNVGVVFCDDKQMPKSMLMNLDANTTQQEAYRFQIGASQPTKKQIWKQIVEAKIKNQAALLNKLGKNGNVLKPYYSNVASGDNTNREGTAARIYWTELMGENFIRAREGDVPNNLLNYGYTILRAAVARAIMGSGMLPALGVFHRNRYNSFPLADDVMEPYRPFVDESVYNMYTHDGITELTKDSKQQLLRLLFVDTNMGKVTRPLEVALSLTTASLLRIFKGEGKNISYPKLE